jgi:hypothetical protein
MEYFLFALKIFLVSIGISIVIMLFFMLAVIIINWDFHYSEVLKNNALLRAIFLFILFLVSLFYCTKD